jgi:hypothetical protein
MSKRQTDRNVGDGAQSHGLLNLLFGGFIHIGGAYLERTYEFIRYKSKSIQDAYTLLEKVYFERGQCPDDTIILHFLRYSFTALKATNLSHF